MQGPGWVHHEYMGGTKIIKLHKLGMIKCKVMLEQLYNKHIWHIYLASQLLYVEWYTIN